MPDKLPCFSSGSSKPQAVQHIIKSAFQHLDQVLAGNTPLLCSLVKIISKLFFQHAVNTLDLLLFPQLLTISGKLGAILAMLPRSILSSVKCT